MTGHCELTGPVDIATYKCQMQLSSQFERAFQAIFYMKLNFIIMEFNNLQTATLRRIIINNQRKSKIYTDTSINAKGEGALIKLCLQTRHR